MIARCCFLDAAQGAPQRRDDPAEAADAAHETARRAGQGVGQAPAQGHPGQVARAQHQRTPNEQDQAERQFEGIGIEPGQDPDT